MKLSITNRILRAGDIQEITWDNSGGSNQNLVVHTGRREVSMQAEMSGTKKLRMKGGSLINWVGLRTEEYGKVTTLKRYFLVLGKQKETDSFEYVGQSPVNDRLRSASDWMKRWWGMYTPEKKRLYIIVLILFFYQLLLPHHPDLASGFLTACIFYIFWIIIRK